MSVRRENTKTTKASKGKTIESGQQRKKNTDPEKKLPHSKGFHFVITHTHTHTRMEEDKGSFVAGAVVPSRHDTPSDLVSRAVRERDIPEPRQLFGVNDTLAFLEACLLDRHEIDATLVPLPQIALLYGRHGSGKNTVIHATDHETGQRVFLDSAFAVVKDFKMCSWNNTLFIDWTASVIETLRIMNRSPNVVYAHRDENEPEGPRSLLILIQEIHMINYDRTGEIMDAFTRLLATVKATARHRRNDIRVLMTCAESPGQLPSQILHHMIDRKHYIGLPDPQDRCSLFLDFMRQFYELCRTRDELKNVEWSIPIGDEDIDKDPDHIINSLSVWSAGTTPREIYEFMRRSFVACSNPGEGGYTDYNADLLTKLVHNLEGQPSICAYNPCSKNDTIEQYVGLDPESTSKNLSTNAMFLAKEPVVIKAQQRHGSGQESMNKKHRPDMNAQEALKAKAEEHEKLMKNAAKREKEKQQYKKFK